MRNSERISVYQHASYAREDEDMSAYIKMYGECCGMCAAWYDPVIIPRDRWWKLGVKGIDYAGMRVRDDCLSTCRRHPPVKHNTIYTDSLGYIRLHGDTIFPSTRRGESACFEFIDIRQQNIKSLN